MPIPFVKGHPETYRQCHEAKKLNGPDWDLQMMEVYDNRVEDMDEGYVQDEEPVSISSVDECLEY